MILNNLALSDLNGLQIKVKCDEIQGGNTLCVNQCYKRYIAYVSKCNLYSGLPYGVFTL